MNLVDRHELMRMPPGTVYQSWEPCVLGHLMVKHDTCAPGGRNTDWYESALGAEVHADEGKIILDCSVCREALFDDSMRYLVYEEEDVDILIAKLRGKEHGVSAVNFQGEPVGGPGMCKDKYPHPE